MFFITNYCFGAQAQLLSVSAQFVFRSNLPTKVGLKWSYRHAETFSKSCFYQSKLFLDFVEKILDISVLLLIEQLLITRKSIMDR